VGGGIHYRTRRTDRAAAGRPAEVVAAERWGELTEWLQMALLHPLASTSRQLQRFLGADVVEQDFSLPPPPPPPSCSSPAAAAAATESREPGSSATAPPPPPPPPHRLDERGPPLLPAAEPAAAANDDDGGVRVEDLGRHIDDGHTHYVFHVVSPRCCWVREIGYHRCLPACLRAWAAGAVTLLGSAGHTGGYRVTSEVVRLIAPLHAHRSLWMSVSRTAAPTTSSVNPATRGSSQATSTARWAWC
jgi:hypothetical protein